jgi:hypothetical protein
VGLRATAPVYPPNTGVGAKLLYEVVREKSASVHVPDARQVTRCPKCAKRPRGKPHGPTPYNTDVKFPTLSISPDAQGFCSIIDYSARLNLNVRPENAVVPVCTEDLSPHGSISAARSHYPS